jgi:hypothetical protein
MNPNYDFLDILMTNNSAEIASDKIKEILYTKSAEKINSFRPAVAQSMFGNSLGIETEGEV